MLKEYGYIRVAAAQNELHLCDVSFNTNSIIKLLDKAKTKGVDIICFPELSLVGYTAQDMFLNKDLYNSVLEGLNKLKEYSKKLDFVFIVGAPIKVKNSLYNCAISFCNGHIIGITPKTYIPNYNEFYEARWFSSANKLDTNTINLLGEDVLTKFEKSYRMKMYLRSHTGFEGNGDMFGKFGLSVDDIANLEVNIDDFTRITDGYVPLEGDLIYIEMGDWLMEIFHVEDEDPFFTLGKKSQHIFNTRKYDYSHEELDTDVEMVDRLKEYKSTDIVSENDIIEDDINSILNLNNNNEFGDR